MSWAIWITGLPGSGKSALARETAALLRAGGEPVRLLELDVVRRALTPAPTYSDAEREAVYGALVYMATALVRAGVPVIIDATAHRRAWRDRARRAIASFAEVQLLCPVEVCRRREAERVTGNAPRGIYARAGQAGATVPGVDVAYEFAVAPELVVETHVEDVEAGARRTAALARRLSAAAGPRPAGAPGRGALWITGRPGSGKTTLARAVAEALEGRGIRFALLALADVLDAIPPGPPGPAASDAMAHTALAYTAKLLVEAGVLAVVDAGASRRQWREAARRTVPHFAEVQLVCPAEVCVERERAARWRLWPAPPAAGAVPRPSPDIGLDHEESLHPDLTLHTHMLGLWSAVEEILILSRRLLESCAVHAPSTERRPTCTCES